MIEMTPIVDGQGHQRGLVAEGLVGTRWAGRFRMFRYEVRKWRNGVIPDLGEAVARERLSNHERDARRPAIPISGIVIQPTTVPQS